MTSANVLRRQLKLKETYGHGKEAIDSSGGTRCKEKTLLSFQIDTREVIKLGRHGGFPDEIMATRARSID